MNLSPAQGLLLRTVVGEERGRAEAWRDLRETFDLDHLEPGSYALAPLLYGALRELAPDDPAVPRLKGIVRHTWYRNQTFLNHLGGLLHDLDAHGFEPTVMRSASLALQYYPHPALRPMGQLELVVGAEALGQAADVLERAGWRRVSGRSAARLGHRVRLVDGTTACVLRDRLLVGLPASTEVTELRIGEITASALGPTHELLLASIGGLRERREAYLQCLADAAMILRSSGAAIDWERFVADTAASRVVGRVRDTTAILHGTLGVPLPDLVLDELEKAPITGAERIGRRVGGHYGTRRRLPVRMGRRLGAGEAPRPADRRPRGRADGDMRARVVGGLAWKLASQASTQLAKVVLAVVFARLLTPHQFGLAAEVLVFSMMAGAFSDFALGAALVQRETIDERDRSTVFWTTVATGTVFTAAGALLAGPIAALYGEPAVRQLLAVASLSFGLAALAATQGALLTRELNFRRLELTRIASTAVSTPVGITVAVLGYGPWAIISVQLSGGLVNAVLLWAFSSWRPRLIFSRSSLRELGSFGGKLFASRFFFYLNMNADNFIVGRFLGAVALGSYSLAYNLTLLPISRVSSPVQQVLFPALSRLRDPRRIGLTWLRGNRILVAALVPAFLGMMVVAPDFVRVVLGSRWHAAVPVLRVMSWVGIVLSFQSLNQSLLQSRGAAGSLLRFAFISSVTNLTAFGIGLHWGIVGVASCYAVSRTIGLPLYTWFCCRAAQVTLGEYVRSLRGVLEAAAAMFVVVLGARVLLLHAAVAPAQRLTILVLLGFAAYGPLLAWRAPDLLHELRALLRPRRERTALGYSASQT